MSTDHSDNAATFCTAFAKGQHRYLALYTAQTRTLAIGTLRRWADDCETNLTLADVLRMVEGMPGGPAAADVPVIRIAE
jgi:hypothetical protein